MTQLRQKMLEELQRRNYSHRTAKTYVRIVREFATYFHQPPDKPNSLHSLTCHVYPRKIRASDRAEYFALARCRRVRRAELAFH